MICNCTKMSPCISHFVLWKDFGRNTPECILHIIHRVGYALLSDETVSSCFKLFDGHPIYAVCRVFEDGLQFDGALTHFVFLGIP